MTTIEKTIDIPEDHRITLDLTLPDELPVGAAEITVTIIPASSKTPAKKPFAGLAGALKDTEEFSLDALVIQRKMRDEW